MSYTRNFGFRSFENIVRDGRHKTPSGSSWLIGTAVCVDPDNAGDLKRPDAAQDPSQGCGILVYEHIQYQGVDPALTTYSDMETVPPKSYAQMVHGQGSKVWFKNTSDKDLYDGRTQTGQTLVAGVGATPSVVVGDYLTPAADGTWEEGTATNGWLYVEHVDNTTGVVECRLTF